jgi:hypothetical protein
MCLTWMNLEVINLSETSQSQRGKYCMTPLLRGTNSRQIHRDRAYNGGCQALGTELLFGTWGGSDDLTPCVTYTSELCT